MELCVEARNCHDCFAYLYAPSHVDSKFAFIHHGDSYWPIEIQQSIISQSTSLSLSGLLCFKNAIPISQQTSHQSAIEENLLSQIHLISENFIMPFWLDNICVFLKFDNLIPPGKVGLLSVATEIHVQMPTAANRATPASSSSSSPTTTAIAAAAPPPPPLLPIASFTQCLLSRLRAILDFIFSLLFRKTFQQWRQERLCLATWTQCFHTNQPTLPVSVARVGRYLSWPSSRSLGFTLLPSNAAASPPASFFASSVAHCIVQITPLHSPTPSSLYGLLWLEEEEEKVDAALRHDNSAAALPLLLVPEVYFSSSTLSLGDAVTVRSVAISAHRPPPTKLHLDVIAESTNAMMMTVPPRPLSLYDVAFRNWLREHCSLRCPFVIGGGNGGSLVTVMLDSMDQWATMRVSYPPARAAAQSQSEVILLTNELCAQCNIVVTRNKLINNHHTVAAAVPATTTTALLPPVVPIVKTKFLSELVLSCVELHKCQRLPRAILITGCSGAGKSTVLRHVCYALQEECSIQASCQFVDCREWLEKSVDSIRKKCQQILMSALVKCPSVIVLDNLDDLCSRYSRTTIAQQEANHKDCIALVIRQFISNLLETRRSSLLLLASSQSTQSVHHYLAGHRGTNSFQTIAEIPRLSEVEQAALLNAHFTKFLISLGTHTDDPCGGALSTKSTMALLRQSGRQDLKAFQPFDWMEIAKQMALKCLPVLSGAASGCFSADQLCHALEAYKPLMMTSAAADRLHSSGKNASSFSHVIGYDKVKQKLCEIFLWPLQYSDLFSQCSIPLQHGVLLYGPSGCGKTLIGKSLAKEAGMNFFLVKGPELLNKYVGSSEMAIRDLFRSARNAAPSLIFFDEFESLAPRRGHDITGVTDRVVNQLLAETDGLEAQPNLYLLAASNRPDLIDPALLRPGRFHFKLFISVPEESDRRAMIHHFMQHSLYLTLHPVEYLEQFMDHFLQSSAGYSPADVFGFLQSIRIEALREDQPNDFVVARREHVEIAQAQFRPSVKHFMDYDNFHSSKSFRADLGKAPRATMA